MEKTKKKSLMDTKVGEKSKRKPCELDKAIRELSKTINKKATEKMFKDLILNK